MAFRLALDILRNIPLQWTQMNTPYFRLVQVGSVWVHVYTHRSHDPLSEVSPLTPGRLHSEQISFPFCLTKMSISLLARSLESDVIEAVSATKINRNLII